MAGSTAQDPRSGREVRPTDNGLHEGDSYPYYQAPLMVFPGPDGKPYKSMKPEDEGGDAK